MDPVWLLEKFREHGVEIGHSLLDLIYGCLLESASGRMTDVPLLFTVVPHEDRAFYHNLEVFTFPYNFIFSSVPGPLLRDDEELMHYGEVV